MKDLPTFKARESEWVAGFAAEVLSNEAVSADTRFVRLVEYEDGHYRALFQPDYFVLAEDRDEPSKSQWNTLKKKFKRHHRNVFVFKDYGESGDLFYIDFGFFAENS